MILDLELRSCGCLGGEHAVGNRGCAGGSTTGRWGSSQDSLHCSLPHWCLHLEWKGIFLSFSFQSLGVFPDLIIITI